MGTSRKWISDPYALLIIQFFVSAENSHENESLFHLKRQDPIQESRNILTNHAILYALLDVLSALYLDRMATVTVWMSGKII